MRVLLIKMSSMGDVIHTLPALTDARRALPDLQIDWVVEKSFVDIPAWHPAVKKIIPIQLRDWRRNIFSKKTRDEWRTFKKTLQAEKYDLIIDAQGLLKSALVSKLAHGKRVGLDSQSAREKIASYFYQEKIVVDKKQLAIARLRELFSKALHYTLPDSPIDYGITREQSAASPEPDIVFLHGTTWTSKEYPLVYWQALATLFIAKGYRIKLSGKSDIEMKRAHEIARVSSQIDVLPALTINQMAVLLANAKGAVAVDTGFAHLAAALSLPVVAIYGATNAALTGVVGQSAVCLSADFICSPCMNRVCTYTKPSSVVPACYGTVPPEKVFNTLLKLIT